MGIFIYALLDPNTNEVRYIGKSVNPKYRLSQHLNDKRSKTHKYNWIKKLLSENLKPILHILEECDENNWADREKYWIGQYNNLTNSTSGGEDGCFNEETRKKMSLLNRGENNPNYGKKASEETRAKLSKIHKGKVMSEEQKKKIQESSTGVKLVIDGIIYNSYREAGKVLECHSFTISKRCASHKYPNYILI